MKNYSADLHADPAQIETFLREWYTHGGPFQITAIPAGGGKPFGQTFTDFTQAARWASDANVRSNIYYHVNGGSDTTGSGRMNKSEVTHLIGVVADIDPPTGADVVTGQAEVDKVAARAVDDGVSLLIHSGRGRQVLVKFTEPIPANEETVSRVEKIGKALQFRYDGDAVWNVDRIMKLPGTVAYPNPDKTAAGYGPRICEIIGGARVTNAPETVEAYFVNELAAVEMADTTLGARVIYGDTPSFPIPRQHFNELVDKIRLGVNRSPHAHILTTAGIPDKNDPDAPDPSDIWWHAMMIAARVTNNIDVAKAALLPLQFCFKTARPDGYKTRAAKCEDEIDKHYGKCLIHAARQAAEQDAQISTLKHLIERVQTNPDKWADLIDEVAQLDEVSRANFFIAAKAACGQSIPLTEFRNLVKERLPKKEKRTIDDIANQWMESQTLTQVQGVPYWVRNGLAHNLSGGEAVRQLRLLIHRETGQTPSEQWLSAKVNTMIAYALEAPEDARTICMRSVRIDSTVYIDLCDLAGTVVVITQEGRTMCTRVQLPSILFVQTETMHPLPIPAAPKHGNPRALHPFLPCSDTDARLIVCTIATWFWQAEEYSILKINGGAGTGKSTLNSFLSELYHPQGGKGASESDNAIPKDYHSIMIAGVNHPLLTYGNLSGLNRETADWLVKTSTGARFETRELFTTSGLATFAMKRPVILNGIDEIDQFSDLNSRAIKVTTEKRYKQLGIGKTELRERYEAARLVILSGIFNGIALALATFKDAPIPPDDIRFQDVARFMWAFTGGAQLNARTVYDDLTAQVERQREDLLASDNIAPYLIKFVFDRASYSGSVFTCTTDDTLAGVNRIAQQNTGILENKVKTAKGLALAITRLADELQAVGISAEKVKNLGENRQERGWKFAVVSSDQVAQQKQH